MSAMAALAGATKRLKFGMNVVSVGLRDPLLLAKQCATIDMLSSGRLLPGFGIGNIRAADWLATGADTEGRGRRSNEALEIIARIAPLAAPVVELDVLRSPGGEEYTRIAFYRDRGMNESFAGERRRQSLITIDTSRASLAADVRPRAPETAPVCLGEDEPLELRVFVDRSVVEVSAFINHNRNIASADSDRWCTAAIRTTDNVL